MKIIGFLLTFTVFCKTVSYGIFEYKNNNNKSGACVIFLLSVIGFIFPNIMIYLRA